jgi:hypothetical protein
MSNSFIHSLSFTHKVGHAIPGSCDNVKTTAAMLAWIGNQSYHCVCEGENLAFVQKSSAHLAPTVCQPLYRFEDG